MGPKCGSESYPPPRDKLRFPEKTLKSAKAGQDASKTAQEPALSRKIAKTLCFTGRNWPEGTKKRVDRRRVRGLSGGERGGDRRRKKI